MNFLVFPQRCSVPLTGCQDPKDLVAMQNIAAREQDSGFCSEPPVSNSHYSRSGAGVSWCVKYILVLCVLAWSREPGCSVFISSVSCCYRPPSWIDA